MKNIYILMLYMALVACQGNQHDNKGFRLIKGETVTFKTNDMASSNPGMSSLYESDSGEYLFLYNHVIKKLQISEFPSNKLKMNIRLEFENEKRAKTFTGGTLIARDSIFVTFHPPAIGMIDFNGDLTFESNLSKSAFHVSHIGNGSQIPLFLSGRKLYGAQPYLMDHHRMKKEDVQKQQLIYSYDFDTNSSQWHDVFYAENYWDEGKRLSYYSWDKRGDLIYIAPFYDHEIQVFDTKTNVVISKMQVPSKHVQKFNIVNEIPGSSEEALKKRLENGQYETLLYDKYRDVFYRVFFPPFNFEENYSLEKLKMMERSSPLVGIMVLDKDLNFIDEHIFDKFEVHPHFLIGKKGLYVSTNNMNRDDFSDDYSSYQLMVLE